MAAYWQTATRAGRSAFHDTFRLSHPAVHSLAARPGARRRAEHADQSSDLKFAAAIEVKSHVSIMISARRLAADLSLR